MNFPAERTLNSFWNFYNNPFWWLEICKVVGDMNQVLLCWTITFYFLPFFFYVSSIFEIQLYKYPQKGSF